MLALLPPSVLDAKLRRRLRRLVAAGDLTPFATAVSGAKVGTADGRLGASLSFAALAASVSSSATN